MTWSVPPSRQPELMDDPAIAEADHVHALAALARINTVSRTAIRLAEGVHSILAAADRPAAGSPVIVDLASGGGDVTLDLAGWLRRRAAVHGPAQVTGVDVSPRAVAWARNAALRRGIAASFEVRDVLADGCPPCDIAVSSLFFHHLDDDAARDLLRSMADSARCGLVVSDLVRSRIGLALAIVATAALSTSRIARVDGPLSVRAARTASEYRSLCDAAGLQAATIRRVWPERVVIRWDRPRQASQ